MLLVQVKDTVTLAFSNNIKCRFNIQLTVCRVLLLNITPRYT